MVEPPVEKEPVVDPYDKDYELDMYDEVLDNKEEYIKKFNAKRKGEKNEKRFSFK